ncbi:MmcQ/YjbR family DNA-binding protein [Nonomuraea lactucae]|uniref:MmcQ/YjbR family DNA-binding protein n=1 Tax=Nonomuraea lactucae TaxID=2249762 RepID=UPI00196357F4|nr:MmcQ/YjbR family DNA-binding protein [Nonomuraea lactucae]
MPPVTEENIPDGIIAGLRPVCLGLPGAYEEQAWAGTRWRVRGRTFAHVLLIESGWPPAYARAAGTDGPDWVLTFRSSGADLLMLRGMGHPFFGPPWRADEVGMVLGEETDWTEVAELITDSYRVLAPKRSRPSGEPPRR